MRKIALLIALTVFGLTQTNAQNFGFKGGYNYSSFNGEVAKEQKNNLGSFKKDLRLDYLNIPVMAKVNLGPLFLQGGVQFGFLVDKPEVSYTAGNRRISQTVDKDAYASFDFGVGAGLGINFNQHFFVEARYTHSLTNALDPNNNSLKNANISDDNNFKNAVLSLGLGVKF